MKKRVVDSACIFLCLLCMCSNAPGNGVLESLPVLKNYKAARASSYDRSGGNADCLMGVTGTVVLAELEGPGAIAHIWATMNSGDSLHLRRCVLRIYWDGEERPSVEAPIGDFFGLGHGKYYHYYSKPFAIGTNKAMNSFWFMPFARSAKVTLTNDNMEEPINNFYYYIDYRSYDKKDQDVPDRIETMGTFHAQYHQEMPPKKGEDYLILQAEGQGHYVGCNMSVELNSGGWWGEGDDKMFVDGESVPSLHGTGSEDYFCGAWCYGDAFYSLYFGCPLRGRHATGELWNVYRYHIEDPVPFTKSIRVMIEAVHSFGPEDPPDNYSSVAYWYQKEPHIPFTQIPPPDERIPSVKHVVNKIPDVMEGEDLKVLSSSKDDQYQTQDMTPFTGSWSNDSQLWFLGNAAGDFIEVEVEIPKKGYYLAMGYFTKSFDYAAFDVFMDGKKINHFSVDGYNLTAMPSPEILLGALKLKQGKHKMKFVAVGKNEASTGYMIGIDCLKFSRKEKGDEAESLIVDNRDIATGFRTEGQWRLGTGGKDFNDDVSWAVRGNGECKAFWQPLLGKSGKYSVFIWYGEDPNNDHAANVPVTVKYKDGMETREMDMKVNCGQWNYIGQYKFEKGDAGYVMISNKADGNVVADAVMFIRE